MRKLSYYLNGWTILSVIIVLSLLSPMLPIISGLIAPASENWEHIQEYMLWNYMKTTFLLVFYTAIGTIVIGTSLAWLIAQYEFPLSRFYKWALILPLSIPPFIAAYTYSGMVSYTGVIQSTLRNVFDVQVDQRFFDIMNIPGAIFIYTMFLYPYVYTITRVFLSQQAASLVESAKLLGKGPWSIFLQVVLPISRAAIIGGVSLVSLEVLNDYGVVKYYGIQTFSTAIFQTWFGLGDIDAAIKLAGSLMTFVVLMLVIEKLLRGTKQFSYSNTKVNPLPKVQLKGFKKWGAFGYVTFIFSLAFLIPVIQLVDWFVLTWGSIPNGEFTTYIRNSVYVAGVAAFVIVIGALIVGNFQRFTRGRIGKILPKFTIVGYSIPGAVIAVAIVTMFIWLDRQLVPLYTAWGFSSSLVLSTSVVMLIVAYIVRFFAIGYNAVESGYDKIGVNFSLASRMLGASVTKTFFKVDIPLLKGAIISGFILVFVDIMKEIPLTLILRPFNFDTLATKAFQYASDEKIMQASQPSIIIIAMSALAIFVFYKLLDKEDAK
ncbi:iron(III) transport system permease protein [Chryseomicrobium aureum]|nr:iron(III) transport system permease protein [Chryseomicrobium aureum]